MITFRKFFSLEITRLSRVENIVFFLIMVILALFFTGRNVFNYHQLLTQSKEFREIESRKIEWIHNYDLYKTSGMRILLIPPPNVALFNPVGMDAAYHGHINTRDAVKIGLNLKGHNLFKRNSLLPFHLSSSIYLFGSLLAMFYGYYTFREPLYLKFLESRLSLRRVFFNLFLSRLILLSTVLLIYISIILLFTIFLSGVLINIQPVIFLGPPVLFFLFFALLFLVFFFTLGTVLGTIRKRNTATAASLALWIGLVLVLPGGIDALMFEEAGDMVSAYKTELEQYEILKQHRLRVRKTLGTFDLDRIQEFREMADEFMNTDYPETVALENRLKSDIEGHISIYTNLSALLPTTHFRAAADEVGGTGFNGYLDFYSHLQKLKKDFNKYILDKVYRRLDWKMKHFGAIDGNIYFAMPGLSRSFNMGMWGTLFYIVVLGFLAYERLRKTLHPAAKNKHACDQLEMTLIRSDINGMQMEYRDLKNRWIDAFFGLPEQFGGKILLNEKNMVNQTKEDFLYIPGPAHFPGDVPTHRLLRFFRGIFGLTPKQEREIREQLESYKWSKDFNQLELIDRARFILAVVLQTEFSIYIFDEYSEGLPRKRTGELFEMMTVFRKRRAAVVTIDTVGPPWHEQNRYSLFRLDENYYLELRQDFILSIQ